LTNRLVAVGMFGSRDAAEHAQVFAVADQQRGAWRPPSAGKETFGVWADRYPATTVHLRPKTRANYESALRVHLLPELGDVEVRRLDRPAARAFLAQLAARGVAAGTVESVRAVLRNVLSAAVEGGALAANPADHIRVARTMRREEPVFLAPDDVESLAHAIAHPPRPARHPERVYPLLALVVRFTAYTGLRSSEVAALRVGRVDLLRRRIEVVEAATEGRGGLTFGPRRTTNVGPCPCRRSSPSKSPRSITVALEVPFCSPPPRAVLSGTATSTFGTSSQRSGMRAFPSAPGSTICAIRTPVGSSPKVQPR
jgi:hypothetical protein